MNNSDGTFESANRVYEKKMVCPTIPTCGGGGIQPKAIRKYESYLLRIKTNGNKEKI